MIDSTQYIWYTDTTNLFNYTLMQYKLFSFLALLSLVFLPRLTHAVNPNLPVRDGGYAAKYVSQSIADPIVIEAGSTRDVTVTFQNTGTATWQSMGAYATAYTVNDKYRSSAFANASWIKSSNPAKFASPVAPGKTGTLTLSLTAPSTPGTYTEHFYLAVDNYSWMKNGYFYLKIQVVPATGAPVVAPPADQVEGEPETPVVTVDQISKVFISKRAIEDIGGAEHTVRLAVRNITDTPMEGLRIVPADSDDAMFAYTSWKSSSAIQDISGSLAPDAVAREEFKLYTPAKAGTYRFDVAVANSTGVLRGSTFSIDVVVTEDAPRSFVPPTFAITAAPITYRYSAEPTIRVGIDKIESGSMTFVSAEDAYQVFAGDVPLYTLPQGTVATMSYGGGVYTLRAGGQVFEQPAYFRFVPATNPQAIFTLGGGFERDITWKGRTAFNTYRGTLEFRRADDSDKTLYAINELLIEDYTAGVAEVSNSAPTEFLKAQAVLSRTYAHFIQGTNKYRDRYFDVVAHTGDQLYLGTAIEETTPNYHDAVVDTRGEMVTYNDAVVITPYFGNSDGKTRSFADVWGGAMKPWLVPVSAEYDLGRARFGHGVGMSQRDAMARAEKEGILYDALIKHYYTGVELEEMFQ